MKDIEEMGPVDYLVLEFPGNRMTGEGIPLLLDLVDRGIVRILDLAFIRKETDGTITAVKVEDMDAAGAKDFEVFVGASSGLLGQEEFREAAEVIEPGNSAGILIYENTWAAPLAVAWRKGGAQVIANGRIPVQALVAAAESGTGIGT
ncbi:DUF6325 family protein [Catellatospora tritici]|uniref:DUF6325 family protein n=1 Tax=Catellatospora tritici TaxID=2851566 RepID=UPI001C2D16BC|nr:DUF6325 family protein [Catellatospora tritici]MBV1850900.1 DUF1269 domain-containing protein [Catellatospora tritici]MBV1851153.1 DUF1269 domain-containing protein [Catellatospora tritici]